MLQCLIGRHPTNYNQIELAEGIRASGSGVAARADLLAALDRMLSPVPELRPNPAKLSQGFQSLRQTMQAEFDKGSRSSARVEE
jgi:hypothetical protein